MSSKWSSEVPSIEEQIEYHTEQLARLICEADSQIAARELSCFIASIIICMARGRKTEALQGLGILFETVHNLMRDSLDDPRVSYRVAEALRKQNL